MNAESEQGVMGKKRRKRGKFFPLGGGTPLYKQYRYVPLQTGRVFAPFWSKNGIDFAQFALESGMVLEGTTGVYERIYRFNSTSVRKREKYVNSKKILRNIFCCCSYLSNEARSENRCEKLHFWSEIESGFGETGDQEFPGVPPPPPREFCSLSHYFLRPCFP